MIKALLEKHIPKAFDAQLSDAVKPFAGSRKSAATPYDPRNMRRDTVSMNYTGRGVFGEFKAFETENTALEISDTKLTAMQSEVLDDTGAPIAIKEGDTINGLQVIEISQDPTSTIWTVALRG